MRKNRYGGHPPCPKLCGHVDLQIELIALEILGPRDVAYYVCTNCGHNWSVLEADASSVPGSTRPER